MELLCRPTPDNSPQATSRGFARAHRRAQTRRLAQPDGATRIQRLQ